MALYAPQEAGVGTSAPKRAKSSKKAAYMWTDGGSIKSNPGPGGAGWVIKNRSGKLLNQGCAALGADRTNNYCEYYALILGLRAARKMGVTRILCFTDSQLMVNQIQGKYRCNVLLQPLLAQTKEIAAEFDFFRVKWISRKGNKEADKLAREGALKNKCAQESTALQDPDTLPRAAHLDIVAPTSVTGATVRQQEYIYGMLQKLGSQDPTDDFAKILGVHPDYIRAGISKREASEVIKSLKYRTKL